MKFGLLAAALAFIAFVATGFPSQAGWSVWDQPHKPDDIRQIPEWPAIYDQVGLAWLGNDVASLETLLSRISTLKASDGSSLQDLAFRSIENLVATTELIHPSQSKHEAFLNDWEQRYPNSAAPGLVRALMLFRFARRHLETRDGGRIVSPGYNPADSGFREAKETLERFATRADAYPYWYTLMIRIEAARRATFDDLFVLADAARSADPDYVEPQVELVEHLYKSRSWSRINIERTIRSLTTDREGKIDELRYARIYRALFGKVYHYRLFDRSNADWRLLRAGLAKSEAAGGTDKTTSQLMVMACLAGDRTEAAAALQRLDGKIIHSVWIMPKFYEDCRSWASAGQPR